MNENVFTNVNGKQFAGAVRKGGKTYKKNTKFFVNTHNGFGIQADLVDEIESQGYEFITFCVKEDLVNYRKMDSRGRYQVVCAKGEYRVSMADLKAKGCKDTLNPEAWRTVFYQREFHAEDQVVEAEMGGKNYFVRDGLEVYDTDNQVREIEENTVTELQRKFSKMVRDSETKAWLEATAKGTKK